MMLKEENEKLRKERDNWKSEYENVCKFATDFENQLAEVKAELSRLRPCRGCPTVSCTCMSELEDELLIKISATQKELAIAREALKYYANQCVVGCAPCDHLQARAALSGAEPKSRGE